MGIEQLLSNKLEVGKTLTATQRWLDQHSRGILDESDEVLRVSFELIYSMGTQRLIEFSPERWNIIGNVLTFVGRFADIALGLFPNSLEIEAGRNGSFPRLRILQSHAGKKLLELVACEICAVDLPRVPVWNLPHTVRQKLFAFIMGSEMCELDSEVLQKYAFTT